MNHQPFETWILDEHLKLTETQNQELKAHLDFCPECQKLNINWESAHTSLMHPAIVTPSQGFTKRWETRFVEKRLLQQKRQIRNLLLILFMGIAMFSLLFGSYLLATTNPADLFVVLLISITQVALLGEQIGRILSLLLGVLPPAIPIGFWILVTTTFSALCITWVVVMWRISFKGVSIK
jgi:hypothetical protein